VTQTECAKPAEMRVTRFPSKTPAVPSFPTPCPTGTAFDVQWPCIRALRPHKPQTTTSGAGEWGCFREVQTSPAVKHMVEDHPL
jgi:hypothetical protein